MAPSFTWPWRRPRVGIAFSERRLVAVRQGAEPWTVSRELPPGLLKPSAVTPNMEAVTDVARLAAEMLGELGVRRETIAMMLPDLAVVTALLPSPARASERHLRQELESKLPFSGNEARCDFWRGRKDEVLAAAVREAVSKQYEQVVEAAECRPGWVDAASLARIPGWARAALPNGGLGVQVQLYASHYCMTVFRGPELVDLRLKLRAPLDDEAVSRELARTPSLYGVEALDSLTLVGEGARAWAESLGSSGALGRVHVGEDGELRQSVSALMILLGRN